MRLPGLNPNAARLRALSGVPSLDAVCLAARDRAELAGPGEETSVVLPFPSIEQIDEPGAEFLRRQIADAGGLKLVCIDPPFDVGADFR